MDRRTFLHAVGTTSLVSLAGCSTNRSKSTPEPTKDPASIDPIPGNAIIHSIDGLTDEGQIRVYLNEVSIPRPVTIELYRFTPSPDDPGTWRSQNFGSIGNRPVLSFNSDGTRVSQTQVDYTGSPQDGLIRINYPQDTEPRGVPLVYRLDLVEHTLDGQQRSLGYTPIVTINPKTDQIEYQSYGSTVEETLEFFEINTVKNETEKTAYIHTTSSQSRWTTPRLNEAKNRSTDFSSDYTSGMFERPWAVEYTITDAEKEEWQTWNSGRYAGGVHSNRDFLNTKRLYRTAFDNEIIARVAEKLNQAAENAGLTSDLAKLRMVTDFAQNIDYTPDRDIPFEEPRVKHPVTLLYDLEGDCEDKVCLEAALLYQDAFPDFNLSAFYVETPGHVGVAVEKDTIDYEGSLDSVGNDDRYLYVESTYGAPLGMIPEDWGLPQIEPIHPPDQPDPLD